MAYTRNWDNTTPAGSSQVSAGDDSIRSMKEDISQRLLSVFVGIDADPLVLKPDVVGSIGAATKKMIVPGVAFQPSENGTDDVTYQGMSMVSDNSGDRQVFAPLILPPGTVITLVELLSDKRTLAGIECSVIKAPFSVVPVETTAVGPITNTTAGIQLTSSGAVAYDVTDADYLHIMVVPTTAGLLGVDRFTLYAVRITYQATSALETL
jgi:hypothetical protein